MEMQYVYIESPQTNMWKLAVLSLAMLNYVLCDSLLLQDVIDLTYSTLEGRLVSAPQEKISPSFKLAVKTRGTFEFDGQQYYTENNHFSQVNGCRCLLLLLL